MAQARFAVERSGGAAFTTYAGRGLLGADHPLDFGSTLARPQSADIIGQSDLVIAIGTTLSECDLWRSQLGHTGRMIRVDVDPSVANDTQEADEIVISDAQQFLRDLQVYLPKDCKEKWDRSYILEMRNKWRAEINAERPGILPVADALKEALPADTMIYSDMTQFAYAAKEVYRRPACDRHRGRLRLPIHAARTDGRRRTGTDPADHHLGQRQAGRD